MDEKGKEKHQRVFPQRGQARCVRGLRIELTRHCVERFQERFRPCMDPGRAEQDLWVLLSEHCEFRFDRPVWVTDHPGGGAAAWAVLNRDLAVPLVPDQRRQGTLVAVTVLAGGGISHAERERRRRRKIERRRRRRP